MYARHKLLVVGDMECNFIEHVSLQWAGVTAFRRDVKVGRHVASTNLEHCRIVRQCPHRVDRRTVGESRLQSQLWWTVCADVMPDVQCRGSPH